MTLSEFSHRLTSTPQRIHLIGVAGSGMSGIAALLLALGHRVSGSDRVDTIELERLRKKGLVFHTPHSADHVQDVDFVIYSSAIKPGNPALDEANRRHIPLFRRADALAAILHCKKGVVVCGMHGKTTTSAMAAHVLRSCGLKPSHYVGAEIPILGTNARWDSDGEWFVAEGDESDGTLINYHPSSAIVLNVEPEHLDFYRDISAIDATFQKFLGQVSEKVFYCADDPGATRVSASHPGAVSYGTGADCHYRLTDLVTENFTSRFQAWRGKELLGTVILRVPGRHNASNALAVIALATELGAEFGKVAAALESFRGARRRFEVKYESARNIIVDDYGHHPTEIQAVLATARTGGWKRVLVMFQPHRYTRTQALQAEFGQALAAADLVAVTSIYPASEAPIPGVSGALILDALPDSFSGQSLHEPEKRKLHQQMGRHVRDGDLIISLGAGDIHESGTLLGKDLKMRDQLQEVMGPGIIRLYEPLSKHTTIKIGGPAQFWVEPETEEGFADLVRFCHDQEVPLMVMGRGSNLLVRDGGIPGVVAHLAKGEFLRQQVEGEEITAGVGVKLKQLNALARNAGLGGFEWMEGIPGNLGGALRMNAGAMGVQTFDQVTKVRCCDQDGNIFTRSRQEFEVAYRNTPSLVRNYALAATLRGVPSELTTITEKTAHFEKHRKESQPIAASAGCIFKNPGPVGAGKLIEELGFKNFSVGGARVSEVHANFIVNDGGASATDVLTLIEEIKAAAERERGLHLETEVQVVGVNA